MPELYIGTRCEVCNNSLESRFEDEDCNIIVSPCPDCTEKIRDEEREKAARRKKISTRFSELKKANAYNDGQMAGFKEGYNEGRKQGYIEGLDAADALY